MTEADRYSIEQLGRTGPGAEPAATWAYDALRRRGADAVPALIEALRDDNWRVRHSAAWLFAELGPAGASGWPALEYALTDIRARVRRAAAVALWRVGPGARGAAPALL